MTDTRKLSHHGVRQGLDRQLENVAARDGVCESPDETQRAGPISQRRLPPLMVNRTLGVVLDQEMRQFVPVVARHAKPEIVELVVTQRCSPNRIE